MVESADEAARPDSDLRLLKRVFRYVAPYKGWLTVIALTTPLGVVAGLIQPLLLQRGIDDHIALGRLEGLWQVTLFYLLAVLIGFSIRALGQYALQHVGLVALAKLRRDVFEHVIHQSQAFFDRRTTGALMTRTTTDVEAVYESLTFGAVGLIGDSLTILGTLGTMFWLDWRLTLITLSFAPIIVFVIDLFRRRLRTLFTIIRKGQSVQNGFFAEQVHGMQVIQQNGAEVRARRRFQELSFRYLDAYRRANWWDAGLYAIMDGMSAIALGLLLGYGATRFGVEGAGITLGLLVAFVDYLGRLFDPIREFSGRIATIQRAVTALERIFDLLDTKERVLEGTDSVPQATAQGGLSVVFEQVTFGYQPTQPVLKDVSFQIEPGEVVAIVGATGSGKTTLGKLLSRMYDGYQGRVLLGGQELSTLSTEAIRQAVAVVHQDAYLFDASVADNIALFDESIDRTQVTAAAERARAMDFVKARAAGLDERITERGANLSGGQRQLLAIARAMARDAPVVLLDEATASVDALTEQRVDEAMSALFAHRTVLVIAHRLSTIIKANRILVLHKGRLVEQGTHAELLAKGGRYAVLVESGFAL